MIRYSEVKKKKHWYFTNNYDLYYKFKPHKKKPKFYQITFDTRNFCYLVYNGEWFVDAFSSFDALLNCPYLKLLTKHLYFVERKQTRTNRRKQ